MSIRRYLVVPILAAVGCASAPATLLNSDAQFGKGRVTTLFTAVDGVRLQEGVWVPPPDTRYNVPAGKKKLVAVRVVHDPKTSYLSSSVFETCVALPASFKAGRVYIGETKVTSNVATISIRDQASGELVGEAVKGTLVALDPVKSCALEAAATK